MNNSLDFTPDTALFKKYWLPLEQAIQKVARFERDFGKAHLALACHAALPYILTPELVNLIRINFLETSVDWIAECDLLLSSLCQPINQGVFEIEPQIRQVLLVALQMHLEYGPGRLEEIAQFLYKYSETALVNALPIHIKRTYQWISGAYIDPDTTIQNMFDLLKDIRTDEFLSRMPDYLHIGKTLALIANPLEMTSLQVELDDLVGTAQLSTLYWTGDKENLLGLLQNNRNNDLDEITHALTKPVVNWLATSEFVASDERSFSPLPIPQGISITQSTARTDRKPVTIFCSYAYEDEDLQKELESYLAPLQARGLITYWHDPMVSPADIEDHRRAIDEYLNTAQIILLLITPDFMASDYHYKVEMTRAMERHELGDVRVIPIIFRHTEGWLQSPFGKLQPLLINAKPIVAWENRRLAFADVVSGIEHVVEELQTSQGLPEIARLEETRASIQPIGIFLAYAHEDAPFLIELENHLSPLHEQGLITTWSDRQIPAGADRRRAIDMHLERASLILLLVSPHFLMSDECSYEVQRALHYLNANGIRVIPIIIRPCMWNVAPFADLNTLPTNGKPISVWENRSAAFADVVGRIKHVVELQKQQGLLEKSKPRELRVTPPPIEIVFVYAYDDESFFAEIYNHLYPLRQKGFITTWSDRQIPAGADKRQEINMHLERASLILLLVSPLFLISDDCNYKTQKALQLYQANEVRIIPIIVRPCIWENEPFAHLQVLPTYSRPITNWRNQDAAVADVVGGILRVIEDIQEPQTLPEIVNPVKMQAITLPIEVFLAYAHEDEAFLIELEKHLSFLHKRGLIMTWSDRQILPGAEWRQEIDIRLKRASIILLLVSPHFLTSNYSGLEMQKALQRHQENEARVIPIIVQPCEWSSGPFAHLPVLPTNASPITNWSDQDEAFVDVVSGIRRVIEELHHREEAVPRGASPITWKVPYRRNPFFTGREDVLIQLHNALQKNERVALSHPQAITGLGGIGKTQTALEYAYRYATEYNAALWVRADSIPSLTSSLIELAHVLGLPEQHEQNQEVIIQAVFRWLRHNTRWLLIYDNIDDFSLIEPFLPKVGSGHIIFTSRSTALGGLAQRLNMQQMESDTGALLLLRRAKLLALNASLKQATDNDQRLARAISQELDGLPLALDQAGAYIEEASCSLAEYLARYQSHRSALLRQRGHFNQDYPDSVATTWSLSIEKATQSNPAAADLLQLCAFLAPGDIPEDIIIQGAPHLGPSLAPIATDVIYLDLTVKMLLSYSLLSRDTDSRTLSIHRLVQAILQDGMSQEMRKSWAERAIRAVNAAFPEVEFAQWAKCEQCLPHALVCAQWIEREQIAFSDAGYLLYKTASYLRERAQYTQAERLFQQALTIQEQILGANHPDIALTFNNLALLYENQGKYTQAEPLLMRALAIQERIFRKDDPHIAISLNNLAELYRIQGKHTEAEPLFVQALLIREQQLGAEHPDTATSLNNLATLYDTQGKRAEAESLLKRALAIREQQLGAEHPDTATSLNNLALLYESQSKYTEAESLLQRALTIREHVLGHEHHITVHTLQNLRSLHQKQGELIEKEKLRQLAQHQGEVLKIEQFRPLLERALREAKEEVIILSPWVNRNACNDDLCRLIGEAIKRGVHIHIGYSAYKRPGASEAEQKKVLEVKDALNFHIPNLLKNLLEMKAINNLHTKMLVCDRAFAITGSFNWLSNLGQQNHTETGTLVHSRDLVMELANNALQLLSSPNKTKASPEKDFYDIPPLVKVLHNDFEQFLRQQPNEYWDIDKQSIQEFINGRPFTVEELMRAIKANDDGSGCIYVFSYEDTFEVINTIDLILIPLVKKEDLKDYIIMSDGRDFLWFDCNLDEASNGNPAVLLPAEPLKAHRGPVAISYEDFERFLRDQKYKYWSVDKPAIEQFMSGHGTVDELMRAISISGNGSNRIYIFSEEDNLEEIARGINWDAIPEIHQEDLSHYIVTSKGMGQDFLYFDCTLDEASNGNPAILLPYEKEEDTDELLDNTSIIGEYYGLVAVSYNEFESFLSEQENQYWYVHKPSIEEFSGGSPLPVEEIMEIIHKYDEGVNLIYVFRPDRPPEKIISATNWETIPEIHQADLYDYIIRSASGEKDFLWFDCNPGDASNCEPAVLVPASISQMKGIL